jgi:hypothetical protein
LTSLDAFAYGSSIVGVLEPPPTYERHSSIYSAVVFGFGVKGLRTGQRRLNRLRRLLLRRLLLRRLLLRRLRICKRDEYNQNQGYDANEHGDAK